MAVVLEILVAILLVGGALISLVAALGLLRLPDLFTRMHAASKAGAVGGGLILVAVAVLSQDASVSMRAVIGVLFLLLTTPVSAHLLARASYLSGYKPCNQTLIDELASNNEQNPVV